ncbi:hypothetical protein AMA91_002752 [Salmonella enterica subsp. enterica serovar Mbandaka]|uniref:Uncharacterized protein n=1 Tax=Salmonella enterica subsp. enterica serovar Bareilly TaxID=58096 RepID=A0A600JG74_SALET|nr:hypothetical protein [Salmonella enterica]EAB8412227.1 hypothetical protein [Salmonella enterica subsp. enterica]EBV1512124.1 hypothetical protein [Salmonella enterica subsp. enterica serovar Tennessee]ECB9312017.1 hypothetical protein [Salmonella enterica subsp. enterica serovar Lille]ECJ4335559.1 hypothetical protein [Salmonella enterica subsp. enterica serovar Senftenberg]ECT3107632.1 hypothetical protein [Salmonella enterica subsp. enterica serovar Bareilly]EDQ3008573.1 hypothetical pr
MECNISELVKSGHERAAELKASCCAVDVRSVAQLIRDLASQLEVQLVRSNTLAAENAHARERHVFIRALAVSILEHSGGRMDWRGAMDDATGCLFSGSLEKRRRNSRHNPRRGMRYTKGDLKKAFRKWAIKHKQEADQ